MLIATKDRLLPTTVTGSWPRPTWFTGNLHERPFSSAMADVAYHFTNLWFAGQHQNWPLAQFYFNESRSHIAWAVRIVPVRKTSGGELHLPEMFDAFDKTLLTDLKKQIADKNGKQFKVAYRAALEGCNACHTAAEKPFLHVVVPDKPEVHIIDLAGESTHR